MLLVKYDGRICEVTDTERVDSLHTRATMVARYQRRHATAGKRPGRGWRMSPSGNKRRWVRSDKVVEEHVVRTESIREVDEWPSGIEENGFDPDDLVPIVVPIMQRAMAARGAIAAKQMPHINIMVSKLAAIHAGMPLPSEEEWDGALRSAWNDLKPKPRVRRTNASRGRGIINPAKLARERARAAKKAAEAAANEEVTQGRAEPIEDASEPPPVDTKPMVGDDPGASSEPTHQVKDLSPEPEPELEPESEPDPEPESEPEVEPAADAPPEGVDVPKGHYYSTAQGLVQKDTKTSRMADDVVSSGWPLEFIEGAAPKRKGERGFTLNFMNKNEYAPEIYGE